MKLGIMQPYFFPYIGYWQLINCVDKYVVYDDVNFINKGWINRNNILIENRPKLFTISLSGASQNKLINEIQIIDDFMKIRRMLYYNYHKAPFFSLTIDLLEDIFSYKNKNLAVFLFHTLDIVCKYLDIKTELILSSSLQKNNELKGEDKILNICKILGADNYINAIGGMNLYSFDRFKDNNIKLSFLHSKPTYYRQYTDTFIPNLSMIDIMMFNSKDEIKDMLKQYELVSEDL